MPEPDRIVASRILAARASRRCLTAPAGETAITTEQAYRVQSLVHRARVERGERPAGWKLGYTSAAMRAQMGIDEPNLGPLTDAMLLADGSAVPGSVIHPRVEPEIALVVAADIDTVRAFDRIDEHVSSARASLEVVDSIWRDYRFTWADNTADGSSAAFVVLGPELSLEGLAELPVTLVRNGERVGEGVGSDAMGDPLVALSWLGARLLERGDRLRAGEVVITGGLCAAVELLPGDVVTASFDGTPVSVHRRQGNDPAPDGRVGR